MAEAQALVRTLDGWSVVDTAVVPTKTPDRRLIFGKGTLEHLTGGSSARVPAPSWKQSKHGCPSGPHGNLSQT